MTAFTSASDVQQPALFSTRDLLIQEVRKGLLERPRSLSPWMFYDARGSALFEQITQLPEYYPTRTERGILMRFADEMIAAACHQGAKSLRVVELGAGTASKTAALLGAAARSLTDVQYAPVDVSASALEVACEAIASLVPDISIAPVVANYVTHPPQLNLFDGVTLGLYIGSSIGNFSPAEAGTILRNLGSQLQSGDALLLGVDMVKDESTLTSAYNDSSGVTAEFNRNVLHRLNKELDADFKPSRFRHRAVWNEEHVRIEMHLDSLCDQRVRIKAANLEIDFSEGDSIHTENSHKFTPETLRTLIEQSGFEAERIWTDSRGWYSVALARAH